MWKRTTYGLGVNGGEPDDGYVTEIQREDNGVMITTYKPDSESAESLEIFIGPDLFPTLREAMDRAERRQA